MEYSGKILVSSGPHGPLLRSSRAGRAVDARPARDLVFEGGGRPAISAARYAPAQSYRPPRSPVRRPLNGPVLTLPHPFVGIVSNVTVVP